MSIGKVYLVGAGPGDPDLITRKGLKIIQTADVVVFDRLIPLELLAEARADAEFINAGKAPTSHRLEQAVINDLLVERALAGKNVARLKGGDPFVFGRGSEEALACHHAGVPFEIVPGVSSSYAVPAYAGIPMTHRHLSSAFTVITGHEDPTKGDSSVNYEAVAQLGGTIVIMMGVNQLPRILQRLLDAGLNPDTPAAIIEWGSTAFQRVVEGTAFTLPQCAAEAGIKAPATAVLGEVVRLRSLGVQWFDLFSENGKSQSSVWEEKYG